MISTDQLGEIAVFGARGHSMLIIKGMEEYWRGSVKVRVLIDDIENGFTHPVMGIPVISSEQRLRDYPDLPVLLTPGSGTTREAAAARLAEEGAVIATATCPKQYWVDPAVHFGPGCVVGPYVRLGPNIRIGKGVQVLSTLVAHDVEIGDFSTLNVNSSVLGHVVIGRNVNIAPNAVIGNGTRDKPLRIGDGAVIGTGAVITRDVGPGARMVGNPAMSVERWKKFSRWLDTQK